MSNVVDLKTGPVGDGVKVPVDGVLNGAREANLRTVLVIGIEPDGEFYAACSEGRADALVLAHRAAKRLVEALDGE